VAVSYEHDNKHSVSIKDGEFHDWFGDCWLLKKGSAPTITKCISTDF
jgi:hypothetical protein